MELSQQAQPKHVAQRQFHIYNFVVTALMVVGSFGIGYAAAIIGTTLAQPSFISYFELDTRPDGTQLIATTNGLFFFGGVLGTVTISWLADTWGRLWAIRISGIISLLSSALLAGSVHIGMFIAFRTVAGAGVFMMVAAVPMWISETAPPKNRGILADFHGIGILLGYSLSSYMGYAFYQLPHTDNMAWRGPFIVGCGPLALHLIFTIWFPESPRWLLLNGKREQAEKTLRRLHTPEEATIEMLQISAAMEVDKQLDSSWLAMLKNPAYRKRALISSSVVVMVESSGLLVINNYGPTIYSSLGFGVKEQLIYQMGFNTIELGGGLLAVFIIDRIARPKLIAIGLTAACSALIVLAAILANFATTPESLANPNRAALRAGVAMIYIYAFCVEWLLNGTMFAYMAELFPTHIRAKGLVVTITSLTAINILWTQLAPTAFEAIGWKFYLCFIIPPMLYAVLVWFTFPNTLGLPLEEIARLFGDHEENFIQQQLNNPIQRMSEDKHANKFEQTIEVSDVA
ncbi:uncharacterized protein Z519_07662 [Cladophialophora bantiana CBS 173.52]|uniref:Major facilitator superfamily (MFS) profile domain-containing protein n=1 Tax=Cladophialophora bantiana (strain ATCC 10958 / CBS 173.52 / CDC B-1940 / NIH 8579) TaxID=1442370 RepID=A0A0D2I474_CLAB1|nr:uncharacterized protein Z519_07662 [Cladophialophora bantiana CBS 173.52]KIW91694.1 hypothetical protein Z519_07662 [Cladophialophora bantiana CBS 173.52]